MTLALALQALVAVPILALAAVFVLGALTFQAEVPIDELGEDVLDFAALGFAALGALAVAGFVGAWLGRPWAWWPTLGSQTLLALLLFSQGVDGLGGGDAVKIGGWFLAAGLAGASAGLLVTPKAKAWFGKA
ncbi:MAG TPA: hypothetical protein VHH36_08105 [Candidatus Thermoplasmatota archaeon]|nr:hypothetical protein [Candidatus Thermoplasmatota archaeon]